MSAALRLTNGFARIDRAWEWDQRSPLFGLRHQTAYLVWRKIVDQAGYPGCKSLGVGETHLSCADVAKMMGKCRSTISRAITYLSSNGLITTQKRGRRVYLFVPHYELTHDMDAYLGALNLHATIATAQNAQEKAAKNTEKAETQQFHATIDPSENQQAQNFRATIEVEHKQAKILEFDHAIKSSRNNRNFHATIESDAVQDLNNEDHMENNCCTKGSKSFAQQSGAILKELTTKNINIIPATPIAHRCAQNEHNNSRKPEGSIEGDETGKCSSPIATVSHDANNDSMDTPSKSSKRPKLEPNQFDRDIAETWAEGVLFIATQLAEERGTKPPKQNANIEAMAKVITALRVIDGYSERDIVLATAHRFQDDFYCDTPGLQLMGLSRIRQVSDRSLTGYTRFENLLRAAYRAKEMRKK